MMAHGGRDFTDEPFNGPALVRSSGCVEESSPSRSVAASRSSRRELFNAYTVLQVIDSFQKHWK